ncbi:hypothetical protein L1987_81833 [Smallanthus sonchifolius]|uniref:Uncharacterized protein n=1 Tax=Smallanthus sonchifolius TaxID=185202 RepID=A0ACB8YSS8_9ASTR|nr:hypothetical protein L1987_81833 [Smallanthus sonchifolius]
MGLISCYNELAVQLSEKSLCSNYKNVSNSVSPNLTPSIQTAATNIYKTTLSTGIRHLITVTWCRNAATQGLQINSGDDTAAAFRLNTNSRLFRKKKGSKAFEINNSKFEVFYDLSAAQYGGGAEPVGKYYVLIMVDSELGLFLGDMSEEAAFKKVKTQKQNAKFSLVSRREHFYGNTLYSTKAQFSDAGSCHDILIRCTGEGDDVKNPTLSVCIDKRVVIRVKRLQWNFRGNQTIFVDGLSVDLMWDVHDWFFTSGSDSGSGSGSGHGVFMFKTRNGLDNRLWLEDKVKTKYENKEFSLIVYATKS